MKNPCGTAKANIFENRLAGSTPVYLGTGVSLVNSAAQYFVAWGEGILVNGLLPTYNIERGETGLHWYVEEEQAEARYDELCQGFLKGK